MKIYLFANKIQSVTGDTYFEPIATGVDKDGNVTFNKEEYADIAMISDKNLVNLQLKTNFETSLLPKSALIVAVDEDVYEQLEQYLKSYKEEIQNAQALILKNIQNISVDLKNQNNFLLKKNMYCIESVELQDKLAKYIEAMMLHNKNSKVALTEDMQIFTGYIEEKLDDDLDNDDYDDYDVYDDEYDYQVEEEKDEESEDYGFNEMIQSLFH